MIGSVQGRGHKIYFFFFNPVWVGAKDNGASQGRGPKHLAPQDSSCKVVKVGPLRGTPKGITPEYPTQPTVLGLGLGLG